MDKKLTLSLNATVVEKAKRYAKQNGVSLSRMIENYLSSITSVQSEENEDSLLPLVKRLVGVIEANDLSTDYRSDYGDYLVDKYR